jgi:transcriptional regulator of acetoin/glycerol metabolism
MDEITKLKRLSPIERYRAAGEAIERHRHAMAACAKIRADAVRELQRSGANMTDLALQLGVNRTSLYRTMRGVA